MVAVPSFQTIGKPVPRVEGPAKVSGAAVYPADVTPPGTLWATNVRSPHPHARIISIDTKPAYAIPGVRMVLTGANIPNKRTGRVLRDMPLLCEDVVRYIGDKVAVVAADTPEAAEEGALAVRVQYEELLAVFDPLKAMEAGAVLVHPNARSYQGFPHTPDIPNACGYRTHARGDLEAGFAQADFIVEHTLETPLTHQGYLEPHACVVRTNVEGRVDVWPSNKLPYTLRENLAELMERPEHDFVIHPITVGADFGGKGSPADVPMAYHLARVTERPVKFVAGSNTDLASLTHRHPSIVNIRTGVKADGTIVAREVRIVYNTGAYGSLKPSEDGMLTGADYACGPYEVENFRIEAFCVYTNLPPSGYMRAPGHPQVAFAVETHTDLVARAIGMDPLQFRLKNVLRQEPEGHASTAPMVLRTAAETLGQSTRPSSPSPQGDASSGDPRISLRSETKKSRKLVGRGIAMCERGTGFGEGSSDVTVNADGTVTIVSGLPDNGTGALTVVAQVIAEELGVPADRVKMVRGTTDALPTDVGSAADRMTNVAGHAALAVAAKVKEQLAPLAASMIGAESVAWTPPTGGRKAGWIGANGGFVSLDELAAEMLTGEEQAAHAQVTIKRPKSAHRSCCVQIAEVEVDPETGEITLRGMTSVQDTGTIINPIGHQGQIDGGLVQGIGFALTEEMFVEDGRIMNAHYGEYKLPCIGDIPRLQTVNLPSEGPGPFQAGSIGEMPCVPTAAAITNAVADAIGAPLLQIPLTAERVLAALEGRVS